MEFLDVKTDFAFKKVFGSEQSKEILIAAILNQYRGGNAGKEKIVFYRQR